MRGPTCARTFPGVAKFILGYGGKWQEEFDDREAAIARAEAVAVDGVTVEVVKKRFGLHSFATGFPESERKALKARWRTLPWGDGGAGYGGGHGGHHSSIGGHGGHGGGHGGH